MKLSQYFFHTSIEVPKDAEIISHSLMLKAGLIKMLSSGIYSYLPLGLRVLRKIEGIIREEMNKIGAIELLMPSLSPSSLWKETNRWTEYGEDMFRLKDRKDNEFGLAPTHEEPICDIVRDIVQSYKKLPFSLYQIQTKFRDEPRPRGGVIRAREFLMKDAYSFHKTEKELDETYQKFFGAYKRIFERCGLNFVIVEASAGIIGGSFSNEFIASSENGEDTIFVCKSCGYSASLEKAEIEFRSQGSGIRGQEMALELVETPNLKSVTKVSGYLSKKPEELIKTLVLKADGDVIAVLIRGDSDLNEEKLKKALNIKELSMADEETIEKTTGGPLGFSGPIGLNIKIIADYSVKDGGNFVVGANKENFHYINVNMGRDFNVSSFFDLRNARENDPCPKCEGFLSEIKGIELGHCFKLGTKYSKLMGLRFLDENGEKNLIIMGCYGIGVSRIIAAVIEQNYDKRGMVFSKEIAPFSLVIINIENKELADWLYSTLKDLGIDVLYDDRDETPGKKFADADLIGIPYQIIIGKKSTREKIEFVERKTKKTEFLSLDEIIERIK
ncbi:MAG: proline--tRNA ligase [bacterium]